MLEKYNIESFEKDLEEFKNYQDTISSKIAKMKKQYEAELAAQKAAASKTSSSSSSKTSSMFLKLLFTKVTFEKSLRLFFNTSFSVPYSRANTEQKECRWRNRQP